LSQYSKQDKLKKLILKYRSCLIAFSGGVDSTFLLKVASSVLPKNKLLAVTAASPTYPKEELNYAKKIARQLKVRHLIIRTHEDKDHNFLENPPERCYFCKKELFSRLKSVADKYRLNAVLDASNLSDKKDFRPGSRAKKELGVRSPLQEAGLTKPDIRRLSRKLGLETWDKPALACLASRIPYGTRIKPAILNRINKGENFLREIGFREVRLRHYNGLCRIEVAPCDIQRLVDKRNQIVDKLRSLGYNYITVDLEGYRTGSMNIALERRR